jgi:hypothetical protein
MFYKDQIRCIVMAKKIIFRELNWHLKRYFRILLHELYVLGSRVKVN